MADATFKGLSTIGTQTSKNWTYYDIELIKRDLHIHFNTRVGERVMRPSYGCKIWDYILEPNTAGIRNLIKEEAIRVCESDSRVSVNNVDVFWTDHGVRIEITLYYIPFETTDGFIVDFATRQSSELGI